MADSLIRQAGWAYIDGVWSDQRRDRHGLRILPSGPGWLPKPPCLYLRIYAVLSLPLFARRFRLLWGEKHDLRLSASLCRLAPVDDSHTACSHTRVSGSGDSPASTGDHPCTATSNLLRHGKTDLGFSGVTGISLASLL
jgi:hypothetical protein